MLTLSKVIRMSKQYTEGLNFHTHRQKVETEREVVVFPAGKVLSVRQSVISAVMTGVRIKIIMVIARSVIARIVAKRKITNGRMVLPNAGVPVAIIIEIILGGNLMANAITAKRNVSIRG